MRRNTPVWRAAVAGAAVAWALVCTFVLGGGTPVLVFFAVWGSVWLAFSLFWRWADGARVRLLRQSRDW